MIETLSSKYELSLKGKRIAAIDFGLKRIGMATCDEFHITTTPFKTFQYESLSFWDELLSAIKEKNIEALVIGVPVRLDNKETEVIIGIENFISMLKDKINIEIIRYDESYSTIRSMQTMIEIGKKKKQRRMKEEKDKMAAAIILRDFLEELEGYK